MRRVWMLLVAGCGRLSFSPIAADGDVRDDTGASDGAPVDVAPSLCGPSSTELVCEGFEDGTLGAQWVLFDEDGNGSLDRTRAYRGQQSFHFHTNATPGTDAPYAELRTRTGLMSTLTGQAYARVWAYVASPLASRFNQMITFSDLAGTGISMASRNGHLVNNDFTDLNLAESATHTLPLDRWTCLQFEAPSGTSGTTRVFVDGVEVADITLSKANVQPTFDNMYIGIYWEGNTSALPDTDAWFDEVILDDAPTTCAQ